MIGALVAGILVGALLGALGGGGSLVAVPLLVHAAGLDLAAATGAALLVVAAASLVGAFAQHRRGQVEVRAALAFGLATMAAGFAGARLARGLDEVLLARLLGLVTLAAAGAMLTGLKRRAAPVPGAAPVVPALPLGLGLGVGLLTGLVGVGGGFLIVPALTLGLGLPMPQATGTSLLVIAMGALAALAGNPARVPLADPRLAAFALAALPATALGVGLASHLDPVRLERAFGALLLLVGVGLLAT